MERLSCGRGGHSVFKSWLVYFKIRTINGNYKTERFQAVQERAQYQEEGVSFALLDLRHDAVIYTLLCRYFSI